MQLTMREARSGLVLRPYRRRRRLLARVSDQRHARLPPRAAAARRQALRERHADHGPCAGRRLRVRRLEVSMPGAFLGRNLWDRRYPVVDAERGIVLSIVRFGLKDGSKSQSVGHVEQSVWWVSSSRGEERAQISEVSRRAVQPARCAAHRLAAGVRPRPRRRESEARRRDGSSYQSAFDTSSGRSRGISGRRPTPRGAPPASRTLRVRPAAVLAVAARCRRHRRRA